MLTSMSAYFSSLEHYASIPMCGTYVSILTCRHICRHLNMSAYLPALEKCVDIYVEIMVHLHNYFIVSIAGDASIYDKLAIFLDVSLGHFFLICILSYFWNKGWLCVFMSARSTMRAILFYKVINVNVKYVLIVRPHPPVTCFTYNTEVFIYLPFIYCIWSPQESISSTTTYRNLV